MILAASFLDFAPRISSIPGYRPAVFDDVPITAIITMESKGNGTRYVFTALHRDEADFEKAKTEGVAAGD